MRCAILSCVVAVGCGPSLGDVGDVDSPRTCSSPVLWVSEDPDGLAVAQQGGSGRMWVRHRSADEEHQTVFTADPCGHDRRALPEGYTISAHMLRQHVACDTIGDEVYRVDDKLLPIGDPIVGGVGCAFIPAESFGLAFRPETREVVRLTDDGAEPLGLFLPEEPEQVSGHWGDGFVVRSNDALFVVASGGLHEVRRDSVSTVVAEDVGWASGGSLPWGDPLRWLLLWEVRPSGASEDDRARPRLLDLVSGLETEMHTGLPSLRPPWQWDSTMVRQLDRGEEYEIPPGWSLADAIDGQRLLLQHVDTRTRSVWDPQAGTRVDLVTPDRSWPWTDGVRTFESGRYLEYPYDGSPAIDLAPAAPAFSTAMLFDDSVVGVTVDSGELMLHDMVTEETTVLDVGVTELRAELMFPAESPSTIYYDKPDEELTGLWSVSVD